MGKTIRNSILIIIFGTVFGFLFLSVSFMLPFRWPEKVRSETVSALYEEGLYPRDPESGQAIDNWADSYSLLIASYEGEENPFGKAAGAYYFQSGDSPYDWLSGRTGPESPLPEKKSYSRYWHGYLLWLRPLMNFLNIRQIRRLNMVCMTVLIILLIIILQRNIPRSLCPFLLVLLVMAPTAIGKCMEYSWVFYIMLLMSIAIAGDWKPVCTGTRACWLFLAGGMLTAYVDFLSAPAMTLSFPLVFLCLRRKGEKGLASLTFSCIVFWFAGYAGMWAGKWLIAFIFQRQAFMQSLLFSISQRASAADFNGFAVSRFQVLGINIRQMFQNPNVNILIVVYTVLALIWSFYRRHQITVSELAFTGFLLIPAGISALWYLILANHSIVHFWLHTFRTGTPALFGLLCAVDLGNLYQGAARRTGSSDTGSGERSE